MQRKSSKMIQFSALLQTFLTLKPKKQSVGRKVRGKSCSSRGIPEGSPFQRSGYDACAHLGLVANAMKKSSGKVIFIQGRYRLCPRWKSHPLNFVDLGFRKKQKDMAMWKTVSYVQPKDVTHQTRLSICSTPKQGP